jgi:hypothetical protein
MEAVAEKHPPATHGGGRTAKRFNLNLSAEAYEDMEHLADLGGGRTMSEVFRLALSILKAVYPAILRGEELYLFDPKTNSERQLIVPK